MICNFLSSPAPAESRGSVAQEGLFCYPRFSSGIADPRADLLLAPMATLPIVFHIMIGRCSYFRTLRHARRGPQRPEHLGQISRSFRGWREQLYYHFHVPGGWFLLTPLFPPVIGIFFFSRRRFACYPTVFLDRRAAFDPYAGATPSSLSDCAEIGFSP